MHPPPELRIRPESLDGPVAQALIQALNEELSARYPERGATHFRLDPEEVAAGRGRFLVAYWGEEAVGCGAIRRLDADTGEIKRMFVHPSFREKRVGTRLLAFLEAEARGLGLRRLVLETGKRQHEAMAFYRRAGWTVIEPFGEYVGSPLSLCMAKDLA